MPWFNFFFCFLTHVVFFCDENHNHLHYVFTKQFSLKSFTLYRGRILIDVDKFRYVVTFLSRHQLGRPITF